MLDFEKKHSRMEYIFFSFIGISITLIVCESQKVEKF